jgi:molybdopterin molybdotransferase
MKEFFQVETIEAVMAHVHAFAAVDTETVPLAQCLGRVLAEDAFSDVNIPDFNRSTMDGFAVSASSTFGASEANPAYLNVRGQIRMGVRPDFSIEPGEAARIATGGMLPEGADSVIMVEHTDALDDTTIEAYRSVAPGQHVIEKGEDIRHTEPALMKGTRIRPQESGLLAACGRTEISVFGRPVVGIISTGDEVVAVDRVPGEGQIRDINTHTLSGQVLAAGGVPVVFGIVRDNRDDLMEKCRRALETTDMVMISGGSSVGARDFTVEVLGALPDTGILVHGISISPENPPSWPDPAARPFGDFPAMPSPPWWSSPWWSSLFWTGFADYRKLPDDSRFRPS